MSHSHNITLTFTYVGAIWEIFEYLPGGFSDAADIRIAKLLGGGNPRMAKISAYKCLLYSVVWVSFCTFWLWWYSDYLVYWFTDDETLVNMIYQMVNEICVGVVIMCVGSDAYYIICAQGRTKLATYICLCSSWIISIPLSLFLTVYLNYNLAAVVFSVIISSVTSTVILLYGKFFGCIEKILILRVLINKSNFNYFSNVNIFSCVHF